MIAVLRIVPIVLEFIYLNTTELSPNSRFGEYTYTVRKVKIKLKYSTSFVSVDPSFPTENLNLK